MNPLDAWKKLKRQSEMETLLKNYEVELGLSMPLTLVDLISSHRRLIQELNAGSRAEYQAAIESARARARQEVLDVEWVKISKLRQMTGAEIADLLYEGDRY